MLFNSWEFLLLLALTLLVYYGPRHAWRSNAGQVWVLLAASAVFYAWEEPRLLLLLAGSCFLNAVTVERIVFYRQPGHDQRDQFQAKLWLVGAVVTNLGLLAFFKYAGFLLGLLPSALAQHPSLVWVASVPLPIGISFYTFHGISLIVDAHRRTLDPFTTARLAGRGNRRVASLRDVGLYILFFPQLIAGPIVKARDVVGQIGAKQWATINWLAARRCLVLGFFLKIFVADNLAEQTVSLTLGVERLRTDTVINLVALLYGYSLQIFADFAGYSLIAIGLAHLFGYRLPENFNFPYMASSITEFWRRWHISLSSWLRDYLYIPLGGSRGSASRTYLNLFIVMFLGGLWHGAAWKFALWGTLHGLLLATERYVGFDASPEQLSRTAWPLRVLRVFMTFNVVTAFWLTFLMPDVASVMAFFEGIAAGRSGFNGPGVFALMFYGTPVIAYHLWGWLRQSRPESTARLSDPRWEGALHGLLLFMVVANPGAPRGFIYFQF